MNAEWMRDSANATLITVEDLNRTNRGIHLLRWVQKRLYIGAKSLPVGVGMSRGRHLHSDTTQTPAVA
jgi:hypothetical protein